MSQDNESRGKDSSGNPERAKQRRSGQSKAPRKKPSKPAPGSMDAILADIDETNMIGGEQSCPSCGYPMPLEAMICLHCGYNRDSGRQFNTKVGRDPNKPTVGGKALGAGAGAGSFALRPFLPIVGALIGGAIGAFIWGMVAYFTGYEVGYLAILVGALCGGGATLGGEPETTGGGMIGGITAAVIAIGAIGAGKYFALEMMFRKDMRDMNAMEMIDSAYEVNDSTAREMFAYEKGGELLENGFESPWDDQSVYLEAAWWPDDYPDDFQQIVNDKWESMTGGEQYALRTHVAEEFAEEIDDEFSADDVDEFWAVEELAKTTAETMIANGQTIDWPDKALPLAGALWPDGYPDDLAEAIDEEWSALGEAGQLDYIRDAQAKKDTAVEFANSFAGEMKKQAVIDSFKNPIQAVFLLFAIATAYGIPANND